MDRVQNSAEEMPPPPAERRRPDPLERQKQNPFNMNPSAHNNVDDPDDASSAAFKYPHEIYSREANWHDTDEQMADEWHQEAHKRVRRAPRPKEENKNTCSLYIQTDPLIWRHIREGIADVSFAIMIAQIFN